MVDVLVHRGLNRGLCCWPPALFKSPALMRTAAVSFRVQSVGFHYVNWPEEQWVGGACESQQTGGTAGLLWERCAC